MARLNSTSFFLISAMALVTLAACATQESAPGSTSLAMNANLDGTKIPSARSLLAAAQAERSAGNVAAAERLIGSLFLLHPGYLGAYEELAEMHLEFGNLPAARAALDDGLAVNSTDLRLLRLDGAYYVASGDLDKAYERYRAVADAEPLRQQAQVNLALVEVLQGKDEQALKTLQMHLNEDRAEAGLASLIVLRERRDRRLAWAAGSDPAPPLEDLAADLVIDDEAEDESMLAFSEPLVAPNPQQELPELAEPEDLASSLDELFEFPGDEDLDGDLVDPQDLQVAGEEVEVVQDLPLAEPEEAEPEDKVAMVDPVTVNEDWIDPLSLVGEEPVVPEMDEAVVPEVEMDKAMAPEEEAMLEEPVEIPSPPVAEEILTEEVELPEVELPEVELELEPLGPGDFTADEQSTADLEAPAVRIPEPKVVVETKAPEEPEKSEEPEQAPKVAFDRAHWRGLAKSRLKPYGALVVETGPGVEVQMLAGGQHIISIDRYASGSAWVLGPKMDYELNPNSRIRFLEDGSIFAGSGSRSEREAPKDRPKPSEVWP